MDDLDKRLRLERLLGLAQGCCIGASHELKRLAIEHPEASEDLRALAERMESALKETGYER